MRMSVLLLVGVFLLSSLSKGVSALEQGRHDDGLRDMTSTDCEPDDFWPSVFRDSMQGLVNGTLVQDEGLLTQGDWVLCDDAFPELSLYVPFSVEGLWGADNPSTSLRTGMSATQSGQPFDIAQDRDVRAPSGQPFDIAQDRDVRAPNGQPFDIAQDRDVRAPKWAVSVEQLVQWRDEGRQVFVVDIRRAAAFESFRMPDSLNLPLFAVKTKGFLRSAPIVLFDEGYAPQRLQSACEQLRQAGFEAWFLFGGLSAWRDTGNLLHGDVFAQQRLNRLPAQHLVSEKDQNFWTILDVSPPEADLRLPLPSISLPFDNNPNQFTRNLSQIVLQDTWQPLVITSQRGEWYDEVERIVQALNIRPVFFLEGGTAAYLRFARQQAATGQTRSLSPSRRMNCPSPVSCGE
jgi:rhodanese-related sulfurtransferase